MGWVSKQLAGRRGQADAESRIAWVIANYRFRVSQGVGRIRTGEWDVTQFRDWGRQELKDTLYTAAEIAAGRRLTRKELYQVRVTLKEQIKYWDRFASDTVAKIKALAAKKLPEDETAEAWDKLMRSIERRAHSYIGRIEAEATEWLMAARYKDGQWFEWERSPVESCETCLGREGRVWPMKEGRLPFYPKDGSTICLFACQCRWRFVKGKNYKPGQKVRG